MLLRFMEGPRSGKTVKITSDEYSLGRDDSCDLLLDADGVSRVHCLIKKDGDTFIIQDNDSTNGVFLNGSKVDEPTVLKDNDTIRISDYLMLFSSDENLLDSTVLAKLDEIRQEKSGIPPSADEADESDLPEVSPIEGDDAKSSGASEEGYEDVVLDFSRKDAARQPAVTDENSGIKALLSGSTGLMVLVVIILAAILVYIMLTST